MNIRKALQHSVTLQCSRPALPSIATGYDQAKRWLAAAVFEVILPSS
jgi:hypothetical protein